MDDINHNKWSGKILKIFIVGKPALIPSKTSINITL